MKDPDQRVVILEQAWVWTCPRCKNQWNAEMAIAELTPDEKESMMIDHGVFGAETGDFVTKPSVVECKVCEFEYATEIED